MLEFAKNELKLSNEDEQMSKDIIDILKVLSKQEHTNFSINYLLGKLNRLCHYQPLSPLTGREEEWNLIEKGLWQNNRCPSVFKRVINGEERSYDIDSIYFCEPNTDTYYTTNRYREYITFPYFPVTRRIKLHYPSSEKDISEQMKENTYDIV